jgi:hypothetical protein
MYMRDKNVVLFLVIFLLFLSFFFLQVESFVNYDSQDSHIVLTDYGPVDSVQIRYDWERDRKDRSGDQNHTPINITEIVIYDKNKRRIPYWDHQVSRPSTCYWWSFYWFGLKKNYYSCTKREPNTYFDNGEHESFPVRHLWDDNMDSMGHSAQTRANLLVNFNSPQEVGSVQITNRLDCCWDRIQNYNLVLYKKGKVIGNKPLNQLGAARRTVNYILVEPSITGETGPQGPAGPRGVKGDRGPIGPTGEKGIKGNIGLVGPQGEQGDTGPRGLQGDKGPPNMITGVQGPEGLKGPQGLQGPQGIPGIKGEGGALGLEGVAGGTCAV